MPIQICKATVTHPNLRRNFIVTVALIDDGIDRAPDADEESHLRSAVIRLAEHLAGMNVDDASVRWRCLHQAPSGAHG